MIKKKSLRYAVPCLRQFIQNLVSRESTSTNPSHISFFLFLPFRISPCFLIFFNSYLSSWFFSPILLYSFTPQYKIASTCCSCAFLPSFFSCLSHCPTTGHIFLLLSPQMILLTPLQSCPAAILELSNLVHFILFSAQFCSSPLSFSLPLPPRFLRGFFSFQLFLPHTSP